MQTNIQQYSNRSATPQRYAPVESRRVQEVIEVGRHELWDFTVIGQAPMPEESMRLGDWLVIPAHQDSTEIPDRALARVQALFNAGVRPKGFVLVHEAPMLLSAPQSDQGQSLKPQWSLDPEITQKMLDGLGVGATVAGNIMAGALKAALAVGAVLIPAVFLAGAVLIDPILIAVTEDDYWIEIDRWWV